MYLHRKSSSLFIISIFLVLVFSSISVYGTSDKDSLLAFRSKITSDPHGIFDSWNESTYFCNWSGVTCGRRHRNRVTGLDLRSQKLQGTLSPHIGNLSFLKTLNLRNNTFSLEIPQELGALFRLQNLYLDNNSFSGEIPTNISRCLNLEVLSLRRNNLGGALPLELGFLSKLRGLTLGVNHFVGSIPPTFGNLSLLTFLDGEENNLQSIPSTFSKLKNLQVLAFGSNKLSGPLPDYIFNLSSLYALLLASNYELNGTLPIDIGLTLPKLEELTLDLNQLSGSIPTSIGNLTSLQLLQLSGNRFTGNVPYLGTLQDLQILGISQNYLGSAGEDDLNFIYSLLNCTSIVELGLNDNNFGGMIPESLSNISTTIKKLILGRNKIRGRIPSGIGNLIRLEVIGMEDNLLSGTIPSSIGNLQSLYSLQLFKNTLSGQIPSSIGNLSLLSLLGLKQNSLHGSIPESIGGCLYMLGLTLSQNNLSGTIPKEIFGMSSLSKYLDLSKNKLNGPLPFEVGKLVRLVYLDVSENNLSGEIPDALSGCTSLERLSMEGNSFNGDIPSSLDSLRSLQWLDLSRNNLSGPIPKYLENNFTFANLNLSWNNFEGQLPTNGVFRNLTTLSVTGNEKLCGGIPELHLPSCIFKKSKPSQKLKHSRMKIIVSLVSVMFGVVLVSFFIFIYVSRKKRNVSRTFSSLPGTSMPKVSYDDLVKATDGFSSFKLIGVGGFGSVYKGILGEERLVVAIKVLNLAKKGSAKSFVAECKALKSIRHRNLVKIITACSSVDHEGKDFKAFVYEFMVNGSLEDWLHPVRINESDGEKYLSFVQRFNIVLDVANALHYMHNECQTPLVHCDLKPSNILLDEDMVARVGDFGLARLCLEASHEFSSTQSSSIGIKGSLGYIAPEYGMGSEASSYGDVYSFGILLLEIFTGKRPTDIMFKDGLDLQNFAKMALPEGVMFIADPTQFQSDDQYRSDKFWECFVSLVRLGVACSVESPRERMNIKKVTEELVHIRDDLLRTRYIVSFHPITVQD